jgi:hypothetical protein
MKLVFNTHFPMNLGPEIEAAIASGKIKAPEPVPMLTNDGSAMIQQIDDDGEVSTVAYVLCRTPYKRGLGHRAVCPIRDDLARRIVDAFNSAQGKGATNV